MQVDQRLVLIALLVNFGCCSQAGEIIEERHHRTKRQFTRDAQVNNRGNNPGINHGGYVGSFPIDQQGPYTAIGNQQRFIPHSDNRQGFFADYSNFPDYDPNPEAQVNNYGNNPGIGRRGSIGGTIAGYQQGPYTAIGNQQRVIPHNNNQQGLFTDHRPASFPDAHVNNYGNNPGISQGGSANFPRNRHVPSNVFQGTRQSSIDEVRPSCYGNLNFLPECAQYGKTSEPIAINAHINNHRNNPGISQGGSAKLRRCQGALNLFPDCAQYRLSEEHASISSTTRSSQRFTTVASTTQRPYVLFNSPECGVNSLPSTRIVGGNNTKVNEYPWAASLIRKNTGLHFCGGSLITERYVLTAAHCLKKYDVRQITIRLGEHSFLQENESIHEDFSILSSNIHEQYNKDNSMNDIAVIKLDRTVSFSKSIALICLPTGTDLFADKEATAIGWGRLKHKGLLSKVLQEVSVPVWSNLKCKAVFAGRKYTIFDGSICAGDKKEEGSITTKGRDSCQGDSGGPLMIQMGTGFNQKWHVIGVTSHGFSCGEPGIPGIYTRVSKYVNWIESNTS